MTPGKSFYSLKENTSIIKPGLFQIIDISYISNPDLDRIISHTLANKAHDDYILDHGFIKIKIQQTPANLVNYFYRLLWESSYIKLSKLSNSIKDTNDISIYITLSEAIGVIIACTPPLLKDAIPDAIKSIPSIISSLKTLIMESSHELLHYQGIFKDHINFKVFDTKEATDLSKFKLLKATPYGTFYVMSSDVSFNDLINPKPDDHPLAFLMVQLTNQNQLTNFHTLINTIPCVVTNVSIRNKIVYTRLFIFDANIPLLLDKLKISYNF
jgi:hypothetical protein